MQLNYRPCEERWNRREGALISGSFSGVSAQLDEGFCTYGAGCRAARTCGTYHLRRGVSVRHVCGVDED